MRREEEKEEKQEVEEKERKEETDAKEEKEQKEEKVEDEEKGKETEKQKAQAVKQSSEGLTLPPGWVKCRSKTRAGAYSYFNKALGRCVASIAQAVKATQEAEQHKDTTTEDVSPP